MTDTRTFIDARTQPPTITTVPPREATVVRATATVPLRRPARPAPVRRRSAPSVAVIVLAAVAPLPLIAAAGFVVGSLGIGLGVLAVAAKAAGVTVVALAAVWLLTGRARRHCPGC